MSKNNMINLNEMFGLEDENNNIETEGKRATEVNLSQLVPFLNHPFKLYQGDRLDDMVQSIKEYGVITPLIVRPKEYGKYEILSGHNRANAGKIVGLEKIPVVIKEDLTDEEAILIVTETNLIQRSFSELSHSEKARILTERHNAIKEQGRRIDLINEIENLSRMGDLQNNSTFSQIDKKLDSRDKIESKYDLSSATVSRYLRIDALIDDLKTRLDNNEIPFIAGVNISFLKEDEQEIVESILESYSFKVDLKKSEILKNCSQGRNFNYDKAHEVLSGKFFDKPKKVKNFKLKPKLVSKFFKENQTQSEIENIIENALELYFTQNNELINELEDEEMEI